MDKEKKNKSDKVDCRKLCRGLRNGDLKGIFVPDRVILEDRELVPLRAKLVRDIRRCKCRIKGMLNFYGIETGSSGWSKAFIKRLKERSLTLPAERLPSAPLSRNLSISPILRSKLLPS